MKRILFFFSAMLVSLLVNAQIHSGSSVNDTANYPYWIEMMQDPAANFYQTQRAFQQYWNGRKITRGCGYKVFKRWEYMMQSRVNPDGSQPDPASTMNAYHQYQDQSRSMSGNWVSIGPSTIPSPGPAGYEGLGRLNVVSFHPTDPNKIYVGAPSGGLWQSTDDGVTWVTHTDTMPTLGVSAIVVSYANPNIILIGTGDRDAGDAPGLGVYKSMDGGISWVASKTGMNNKTVGWIIQHPSDPQIFLAATSGGVYRSTDGGTTWTVTQSGNFKDIQFKPNDPTVVYAAVNSDFYRSSNSGLNFTKITSGITSGQRGAIAVSPANPNYVYFLQSDNSSGFKCLYRSTDAGLTFSTQSNTPNILDWSCDGSGTGGQGWYDLSIAADPNNAEVIYVGGVDVWKSTNGGVTWEINSHWYGGCSVPAVHADCHFLGFSPVNGKLYAGNDGGIYSTSNGGTTWSDHTVGMTIGQIYKLGQAQTVKNKVINGFQDNGTYSITPSGWIAVGGGDGMECTYDYTNAAYSYHTLYYGSIFRRINNSNEVQIGGKDVNGITEEGAWVTPFTLSKYNHKTMFVGYKNIWRSNDVTTNPVSWTQISNSLAGSNSTNMSVVEHCSANENILYAARSDNKLFRTDDCLSDNPVWYDLSNFLPTSATPTDIKTIPGNENIVYMALSSNIYKSTDKGLTWTSIKENLPTIPINSIACYQNALDGLYIGTDAGVYYKDQGTNGWVSFSDGLPVNAKITEVEIYYDNDSVSQDVIRASSYGRGLWGSDMYHQTPEADFTTAQTTIPTGCAIDFKDLSSGVPTDFQWYFQGGSPSTSTLKNPTGILYSAPGTYEVKLKVWNVYGADSVTKVNYITVSGSILPEPDFTADRQVTCQNEVVHFIDKTLNCPISWIWQFDPATVTFLDGTSFSSQNPVVLFNEPGPYDVQLTVYNAVGPGTVSKQDFIYQGGFTLPFAETFSGGFSERHWKVINPDFMVTWDTISVAGVIPGSKALWMNFFDYPAVDRRDQIISPALNFSGYGTITLHFKHAYEQRIRKDSLIIRGSDNCGESWVRLWGMGPDGSPNTFVTHPSTLTEFFPQSTDDWCGGSYGADCYAIDLSDYSGKNNVQLMFESYNRYGNNLFINDIVINGTVGTAELQDHQPIISLFPNPTSGIVNINITGVNDQVMLMVFTPEGQKILQHELQAKGTVITGQLDLSKLSTGIYFIKLTGRQFNKVEKIVIL